MSLRGLPQFEIARQLGISQGRVSQIVTEVRARWISETEEAVKLQRAEQVAKIDYLYRVALEAWEKSTQNAEIETTKISKALRAVQDVQRSMSPVERGKKIQLPKQELQVIKDEFTKISKGQSGNAAFLSLALSCLELKSKLLGLLQDVTLIQQNNITASAWDTLARDLEQHSHESLEAKIVEGLSVDISTQDDALPNGIKELSGDAGSS